MRAFNIFSASWDETIIIWNLNNLGLTSLTNLSGHNSMVNTGAWNPKTTGTINKIKILINFKISNFKESFYQLVQIENFEFGMYRIVRQTRCLFSAPNY